MGGVCRRSLSTLFNEKDIVHFVNLNWFARVVTTRGRFVGVMREFRVKEGRDISVICEAKNTIFCKR